MPKAQNFLLHSCTLAAIRGIYTSAQGLAIRVAGLCVQRKLKSKSWYALQHSLQRHFDPLLI